MTDAPRWLAFTFAGTLFALPGMALRGVIARPAATRVPGAPRAVLGLVAWRGRVLPLVVPSDGVASRVSAAVVVVAAGDLVAVAADTVIGWAAQAGEALVLDPANVVDRCRLALP